MEAAAAAEAAEAAVDSLGLDSVGVDVHATDGDDEMALAAAGELQLMFAVKNILVNSPKNRGNRPSGGMSLFTPYNVSSILCIHFPFNAYQQPQQLQYRPPMGWPW